MEVLSGRLYCGANRPMYLSAIRLAILGRSSGQTDKRAIGQEGDTWRSPSAALRIELLVHLLVSSMCWKENWNCSYMAIQWQVEVNHVMKRIQGNKTEREKWQTIRLKVNVHLFKERNFQQGAFFLERSENYEKRVLASSCLSVLIKHGSHRTNYHEIWYLSIFRKSVEEIQFSFKSDKNNAYFRWIPIYIFHHISLNSS